MYAYVGAGLGIGRLFRMVCLYDGCGLGILDVSLIFILCIWELGWGLEIFCLSVYVGIWVGIGPSCGKLLCA